MRKKGTELPAVLILLLILLGPLLTGQKKIMEIRGEDVSAAVKNYQKFIEKYADRPTPKDDSFVSVRSKVILILLSDKELLAEYGKQFSPAAEESFKKASKDNDLKLMEQIVEKYYPAKVSVKAVAYLAAYHLDHGELGQAQYHLDMLQSSPFKEERFGKMRSTIISLLGKQKDSAKVKEFPLAALKTEKPVWIGGVTVSTVYPEDIASFKLGPVIYPVLYGKGKIIVNSGKDVYCYDASTGRHLWKPGPYHEVRTLSIFKGDMIPVERVFPSEDNTANVAFPAGALRIGKGSVTATLNKLKKTTSIIMFDLATGKATNEISSPVLVDLLNLKGERLSWGKPEICYWPAIETGKIYIGLKYVSRKREECFVVSYSVKEKKVVWTRKVYEASVRYSGLESFPFECSVQKAGPYVSVFSYTGYIGVFNGHDGKLIWERALLPESISSGRAPDMKRYFKPIVTPEYIVIEGVGKNTLTCFDIAKGSLKWKAEVGMPVWGLPVKNGIICAVEHEGAMKLVRLDPNSGKTKWEYAGVSIYPGQRRGDNIFCTDKENVLKINLESGKCMEKVQLKNCVFPGKVVVGDLLYIINTGGIFAYATK
jgi:outer membrane protein assembly factor BamB